MIDWPLAVVSVLVPIGLGWILWLVVGGPPSRQPFHRTPPPPPRRRP